jgi:hypothetical protein
MNLPELIVLGRYGYELLLGIIIVVVCFMPVTVCDDVRVAVVVSCFGFSHLDDLLNCSNSLVSKFGAGVRL